GLRRTAISSLDWWPVEGPRSPALGRSSDSALSCFAWSVIGRIVEEVHSRNTRKHFLCGCAGPFHLILGSRFSGLIGSLRLEPRAGNKTGGCAGSRWPKPMSNLGGTLTGLEI